VLLFLGFVATGNFSSNKARQSAFCLNPEDSPVVGDGLAPNERVTSLYLSEAHVLRLLPIWKELVVYAYWHLFQICPKSVRWFLLSWYSPTFFFVVIPNMTGMTGPNLLFCVSIC